MLTSEKPFIENRLRGTTRLTQMIPRLPSLAALAVLSLAVTQCRRSGSVSGAIPDDGTRYSDSGVSGIEGTRQSAPVMKIGGQTYDIRDYHKFGASSFHLIRHLASSGNYDFLGFLFELSSGNATEEEAIEKFFVSRMVLRQAEDELKARPTHEEIVGYIRGMGAFADKDGKTGDNAYGRFVTQDLGRLGLTEADFVDLVGDMLAAGKIKTIVATVPGVDRDAVARELARENQRIEGDLATLDIAPFKESIQPTDEAVKTYWESNKGSFMTAFRRKFSYILVTPAFPVDASDPDAAKAARLAETRRMAQIASDAKVDDFITRLEYQPPISLEAIAKDKDFNWVVKTTGFFTPDQVPADLTLPLRGSSQGGTVADILFRLQATYDPASKLASPIAVGDGQWLIARLDGEEKAREKTLTEARDEIRARYVSEKAAHAMATAVNEAAARIQTSLAAGKPFATAAREAGPFEIKPFNNLVSSYRPNATEPANFFESARDTEPGGIAGPVIGEDRGFIIHVTRRVALPVENAEARLDAAMKLRNQLQQSTAFINWIAIRTKAARVERLINR